MLDVVVVAAEVVSDLRMICKMYHGTLLLDAELAALEQLVHHDADDPAAPAIAGRARQHARPRHRPRQRLPDLHGWTAAPSLKEWWGSRRHGERAGAERGGQPGRGQTGELVDCVPII
eukprot:SAG11_NODE_1135_length_5733_cov_3.560603_3_plen_118_part_00